MNATIAMRKDKDLEVRSNEHGLLEWFKACDQLLDEHRQKIVLKDPTPEELKLHQSKLSWFIRLSRAMSVPISDPEIGDQDLTRLLQTHIRQLELAQSLLDGLKLSNEEIETFSSKYFPE